MTDALDRLLATERVPQARGFRVAAACAALLGCAAVALMGVSGWFIAAAAGAGAAGTALAFNYMLPSAAIRLGAIVRTGARYGERLAGHEAALLTMARVRPALFAALARAAPARALAVTAGEAATSMVQDIQAIELRLVQATAGRGAAAAALAGVGLSALAGWAPALSAAGCLAAMLLLGSALAARAGAAALAVRDATGALKEKLSFLEAAKVELRCYGLDAWAVDTAQQASAALESAQRRHAFALGAFDALQALMFGLAATAGAWLARDGGAPLAALAGLSAATAIEAAAPSMRALAHRGAAREAARRLDAMLEAPAAAASCVAVGSPSLELAAFGGVRLDAGERVAIVGASGCGKTTLVETLIGLREGAPGALRIGASDAALLPLATRRSLFAWVPQDCAMLCGTLRDNLSLADAGVDEAAMWRALRDAALADLVQAMPQGLDTWIGEDGARLSGGERRRLALARAYLSGAPWLLLDEPTEGLDAATEAAVLAALEARLDATGQGLIVVSHRSAVVWMCDRTLSFREPQALSPAPSTA